MSYYTVIKLSRYLGVSSRTIERWWAAGKLPEPERDQDGTKLWTPQQAREILAWHLARKKK